jgi:hypothetical protein
MESHLVTILLSAAIVLAILYLVFSKMPGWNEQETPEKQAEAFLDRLEISHSAITCRKYNQTVAYCSVNISGKLESLICYHNNGCQVERQQ